MKSRSIWLIFAIVAIAQFMVVLDTAITNVALPTIKSQMHFSNSTLQWVVTAYALTFGGFLLLGGRAADLFGRRRTLLSGMIAFTLFSFLIGASHSELLLISLRSLQGMAAAFMSPAALSIVLTTFHDGADRNRALAFWALVSTGGVAVGLLLGGVLTQYVGWRWDFFVNVPVGIVMTLAIKRFVPAHSREGVYTGLDLPGAVLVTGSLMSMVFGFSQATNWGWTSLRILGIFAASLALLVGFIVNESRAKHPLVPLRIFKVRNVMGANLMRAPIYGVMLGVFFIVTIYIQTILHYSPIQAGLAFLPMPVVIGFVSTRMPKMVARYGFHRFLIIGPLLVALGIGWLSLLPVHGSYLINLLPALILISAGMGMTFMPMIAAATSGVPANEAGLASGLITTSQQMGGALGLSVISSVAASVTAASGYLGTKGSLVHGFDRAMLASVAFIIVAILVAVFIIHDRNRKQKEPTQRQVNLKLATEG